MSKRLITDRDVLEGRCGARIVLDGGTLITPSARDRAMRLGIAVVEDGIGSGAESSHLVGVPGGNAGQDGSFARSRIGSCAGGAVGAVPPSAATNARCTVCGAPGAGGGTCGTCGAACSASGGTSGEACATCGGRSVSGTSGATCATCGASSANSATCGRGAIAASQGLPDGLYLVRVDGGRVVSTLPAAGAGLMPRATTPSALRS